MMLIHDNIVVEILARLSFVLHAQRRGPTGHEGEHGIMAEMDTGMMGALLGTYHAQQIPSCYPNSLCLMM
jgi:hypothetical protein